MFYCTDMSTDIRRYAPILPPLRCIFNLPVSCQKKTISPLDCMCRTLLFKLRSDSARCQAVVKIRGGRSDFGNLAKNPRFSFIVMPSCGLFVQLHQQTTVFYSGSAVSSPAWEAMNTAGLPGSRRSRRDFKFSSGIGEIVIHLFEQFII